MKSFTRRDLVGLLGLGALATLGCGVDNESEAEAARKAGGDPGPINPKSKVQAPPPPPTSQRDLMPTEGNPYAGTGYPGAKAQKK